MVRRLYVHNYRCLQNFELDLRDKHTALLIGDNGSGKTTISRALEVFQKVARGTNRVAELATKDDTFLSGEGPMRFTIEAQVRDRVYEYGLALEMPPGFREMRVFEEKLTVDGEPVFDRSHAQVSLKKRSTNADFAIDWHMAALPIVQEQSETDPLFIFRQWLARLIVLRPVPALMRGESTGEHLEVGAAAADYAAWFSGLLAHTPAAYGVMERYLKELWPDFRDIQNPRVGPDTRSLAVHFANEQRQAGRFALGDLSDGEKCFLICATLLAANETYGPITCFWDELDGHLALSEVGHFVMALRRGFERGQLIATSHNPEAIRKFSDDNTFVLFRRSHLEPAQVRPLADLNVNGDLVGTLIRGDLEP